MGGENPRIVLSVLGVILAVAAGVGVWETTSRRSESAASAAVARVETAYREAMGAQPGDLEVPEPANPETARAVREDFAAQLLEVADAHSSSHAAVMARIEAGTLQWQNGDREGAIATWRLAARDAPDDALRGLALQRLAVGLESRGDPAAAAQAYAEAGALDGFPGRVDALAQAARCWLDAGERQKALDIYARIEAEGAKPGEIPEHIRAALEELRAQQGAARPTS